MPSTFALGGLKIISRKTHDEASKSEQHFLEATPFFAHGCLDHLLVHKQKNACLITIPVLISVSSKKGSPYFKGFELCWVQLSGT